jgi:GTP-binding protein
MIPVDTKDVKKDFNVLRNELIKYNPELADKEFLIAFTKSDLMDDELIKEFEIILKKEFKSIPFFIISSVNTFGISGLKEGLWRMLNKNE